MPLSLNPSSKPGPTRIWSIGKTLLFKLSTDSFFLFFKTSYWNADPFILSIFLSGEKKLSLETSLLLLYKLLTDLSLSII